MAYETPLKIKDVMQDIYSNRYVLPSIQREYVWSTEQIEALFDSLMREYPIGTFLFWEIEKDHLTDYSFYGFIRTYNESKGVHNQKIDLKGLDRITAVLDGQQRLTSLYLGLKGTYAYRRKYGRTTNENAYPVRKLYLNLISRPADGDNKYDFKFLKDQDVRNDQNTYWFEVGQILDMDVGKVGKYWNNNICNSKFAYKEEQKTFALETLSNLNKVINEMGTISYYREKAPELDKVLNIFIRVNSGGTKLSYSDLLLSIAAAQWETHDAREEIINFVDNVNALGNGFYINKDFVLKTALVLSDISDIAFRVKNFTKSNMKIIEGKWDDIKTYITQAVNLVSSFGYSGESLTSNNALIPIAYYLFKNNTKESFINSDKTKQDRENIKKWLIRSLLKKVFSGQPDNVLGPIRRIINKNGPKGFPLNEIIDEFKGTSKTIQFSDEDIDEFLLKLKYGKSDTLSTLMLMYPSLDFNNRFHVDHIYPKSKFNKPYLRKMGIAEDKLDGYIGCVNNISNLQLLPELLNEEKSDKDFDEWFNQHLTTDDEKHQYRNLHYLPEMEYTYSNFPLFINKRMKLLQDNLRKILR